MKNTIISRWFNHSQDTVNTETSPLRLREGLKILIVDDSRTHLYALEKMLKAEGVETYTAENGKQGILMTRHIKPDLVLMDIVMPEINGFQATRYLSRQEDTGHIPIVIISGSDQESDKAWGLKLGAKDYLQKPVNKTLLLETISRWTAEVNGDVSKPLPVKKPDSDHGEGWVEAG